MGCNECKYSEVRKYNLNFNLERKHLSSKRKR